MTGCDKFVISILDAIAHGPFFNESLLWERSGYKKIDFEIMIDDIKNRKINVSTFNKTNEPKLYKMITKSLVLLTMFLHDKDDELKKWTKQSKEQLKDILIKIWGKDISENEYNEILNQS